MRGLRQLWLVVILLVACGDDEASDEALIEKILEDVTGDVDEGYVARALSHVDVARYGIDVRVAQHAGVYDAKSAPALFDAFRTGVSQRLLGSTLKRRSTNIAIEGDQADVGFGLVTRFGPARVSMTLRKPAPGVWKVTRVYVER